MEKKKAILDDASKTEHVDEQTNKRIHEHLTNIEDVISEEDIANVKTDIVIVSNEEIEEEEEDNDEETATDEETNKEDEEKIKDNFDPSIGTTWNLLDS